MPTDSSTGSAEPTVTPPATRTTTRSLAGLLGVATGGYALVGATGEMALLLEERLFLLVGLVAVGHGVALAADAAALDRLGRANGPLGCCWAGALWWLAVRSRSTAGFADGNVWASNLGDWTWLASLAAASLAVGLVVTVQDLRSEE
ncbi:hypothetical protein [Halorussus salinus]|uniref:hypothetical protein n=1 Tax=Halorussus salinus TaxID=1364935 RepID=UPI00109289F8|nr:hypothetical protein [Halorussus salinus]